MDTLHLFLILVCIIIWRFDPLSTFKNKAHGGNDGYEQGTKFRSSKGKEKHIKEEEDETETANISIEENENQKEEEKKNEPEEILDPVDTQKLQDLLVELEEPKKNPENWKKMVDKEELQIYRKIDQKYCFWVSADLENSAEFCHRVMTNVKNWTLPQLSTRAFPSPLKQAKVIQQINGNTSVIHVLIQGMILSSRDLLFRLHKRKLADQSLAVVAYSVTSDLMPERDSEKITRVETNLSGAIFKPTKSNRCRVTYLVDGDPKGNIPDFFIRMVCSQVAPQGLWIVNKLISHVKPKSSKSSSSSSSGSKFTTSSIHSEVESLEESARTVENTLVERAKGNVVQEALKYISPYLIAIIYFLCLFKFAKSLKRKAIK